MLGSGSDGRRVKDYLKKAGGSQYEGTNRRAIGLLPEANGESSTNIPVSDYPNRQRLLVAIEANQSTCCVKMVSRKQRSRGALLIFRGRVLGAVYGSVNIQGQLFHGPAFASVCKDIIDIDTKVIAYTLPEPLAVATGALFHGQFSQPQVQSPANDAFGTAVRSLAKANMPGCVMVNDEDNIAVLSAYIFGGKIVALYSGREGWLPATLEVAAQQMAKLRNVKVSSAVLQACSIDEVLSLTSSLSGLADRKAQSDSKQPVDPSLRVDQEELDKLKDLEKGQQASRLAGQGNDKDAMMDRELFLRADSSRLVNP